MLYNHLRIRHTYLTHYYSLKLEDLPVCIICNYLLTVETVKYILIYCVDFVIICQNFYAASSLGSLHNVHPKRIVVLLISFKLFLA